MTGDSKRGSGSRRVRGGRPRGGGSADIALKLLGLVGIALATAAWCWPDLPERIAYPRRFATSGRALLPIDRYAAAARGRVTALALPHGAGPVVAWVVRAGRAPAAVYLDPPTAHVLQVVPGTAAASTVARPAARLVLNADEAIARAQAVAPGRVDVVRWPTARRPDWAVRVGSAWVWVADDGAIAAPSRGRTAATRRPAAGWWPGAALAGGLILAVLSWGAAWWRMRR